MALPIVGNTKGLLLLSLFLLSIVDSSLAESNESLYGFRANRVLKSGKSMKKKGPSSSKSEKKHKKSKKHHSSPTGAPTGGAPEPPVVGCYMSESVREAGYENGACDCEITEEACLAEPKEDAFPIWTDGCRGICLCPSQGFGCYKSTPEHECDCSEEACEGGQERCSALDGNWFWTGQCTSCQCPSEITTPTCKPDPNPENPPTEAPEPPLPTVWGCYVSQSVRDAGYDFGVCDCTMTEEQCDAEPEVEVGEFTFPIWTDGCYGICLCSGTGWGCYSGPPTHECDCSEEACEGGEEACNDQSTGIFPVWTDGCTSCQCPAGPDSPACAVNPKPDDPDPEPAPGDVSGCYVSQSVREAGYQSGACDCEMTEEACLAEPKEDGFPIWTNGCQGICLCPSSGWGCYHFSEHECDCSAEACEGEEEACEALGQGHFWTSGCTSCQCPNKINTPTCKIDPKPDPNPGPGPTPTGSGCYRMLTHDCECTEEVCSEEQCTDDGGIWVENECTSCQCPGT